MKLNCSPGVMAQMDAALADAARKGDEPDHFVLTPKEWDSLGQAALPYLTGGTNSTGYPTRYYTDLNFRRDTVGHKAKGRYRGVWVFVVDPMKYEVE